MDAVTTQTMQTTIFYPIVDVVVMSQQIILSYFLRVPKTMEIQRIDFYVRIDPNSKRSQGEVTSSILKKKQIIIFSVRD